MGKKKTTDEFKREVYNLVGDEYEILEDYRNAITKILIKHNTCGNIYKVNPNSFLQGRRCPKCNRPNYNRNTEQFKKEVYDLVGDEYSVLGEYEKAKVKTLIRHNTCGHTYTVTPDNFLRGTRCPKCKRPNYNRDTEQFKKEVYDLVGDEYSVLGEYKGCETTILLKHNKCGYLYDTTTPITFLKGVRCPRCSGYMKKTQSQFEKEVYDLVGNEYLVIGRYTHANKHLTMKHIKCGHEYLVTPNKFINAKRRCPKCYGNPKKTTEEFKKAVYDLVKDEYTVLGEYDGSHSPILLKHNKCGYEYCTTTAGSFLSGSRCPKCSSSKGEVLIDNILNKYNIKYEYNKPFGNCTYKDLLKFDFLIFDKEENLKLIIEFDGIQHFEPVGIFGGEEAFNETQKRDKVKNDFCKENNIPLLRIPYWEIDNIHRILGKKLYKLGLI